MLPSNFYSDISKVSNRFEFEKHFNWFIQVFELTDKSKMLNNKKINNLHPIRPKKGEIYLIEFGQNVGSELSNTHMGIIIQDSAKNNYSSTVIVVPISSSPKIYDTHEIILFEDLKNGYLNKLPSKAKVEQMICVDKARLIHRIGELTPEFMNRLARKVLKVLDIK
ncbi:MAG: type II toxin-antitoxin system PemK/MazF family toxin [Clostridia bacterium]|nr:type II toxin-antitoxin system PemK/MazF family toxin [Clostridia bacterium]